MKKTDHPSLAAIVLIATLAFTTSVHAQEQTGTQEAETLTPTQQAIINEMKSMTWLKDTTIRLPDSHAKLVIPSGYSTVLGQDAKRLYQLINGTSEKSPDEAEVLSSDPDYQIDFAFFQSGYVNEGDWDALDPSTLLQSVIEATEDANKERRANGVSEIHVIKWLHEPTLDKSTHTVYWTIQTRDEAAQGDSVNAIAIRLGRAGFERLIFITNLNNYQPVGGPLDLMLRAFSFPAGATYEDHISTDKAAGYGIAALVGALVGAKVVKVAAAGGLALFFKPIMAIFTVLVSKAWVLLLAPFLWLKSLFNRHSVKQKSPDVTPPRIADDG